jgi:UDP:flavonoid glycosyltransferase YjiC (YdhE family)
MFSTTGGAGHFGPLVPFAGACREAGHEVRVAAPASFARDVVGAGFEHVPFDDVDAEVMGAVFARLPSLAREEANRVVLCEVFADLDARAALPGVTAAIETWRPDLVVREPAEFASWITAERARIPQVEVAIGAGTLDELLWREAAAALASLRADAALPADPGLAGLRAVARLTTMPPSFDAPSGSPRLRFRHDDGRAVTTGLPPPWGDAALPLVYVSFGSVAGSLPPFAPIFDAVTAALADAPYRVLLTTGHAYDPARVAALPANVRAERWWPQADVMPQSAVVVGHGGFGTTMTALAAGVPQVVIPLFAADQFLNAELVARSGVGVTLDGGLEAVLRLPAAIEGVLADPSFRHAAAEIVAEIESLPPVADAVPLLESIASRAA